MNADIDTRVVSTEVGNALKIINRTGAEPNRVGVMEQIVNVSPGTYELSFDVKGEALEQNALQITTTPDWRITDPDGIRHGIGHNLRVFHATVFADDRSSVPRVNRWGIKPKLPTKAAAVAFKQKQIPRLTAVEERPEFIRDIFEPGDQRPIEINDGIVRAGFASAAIRVASAEALLPSAPDPDRQ